MRNLGLLLLVCVALFFTWTTLTPTPTEHGPTTLQTGQEEPVRKVTLSEVTAKSTDTLKTTATYLGQEKEKIQARMSVTLQKLDQQISLLRNEAGQAGQERKSELNQRISNLEDNKARLVDLRKQMGGATETAWNALKQNWNRMEIDINAHIVQQPEGADAQSSGGHAVTGSPAHE